MTGAKKRVSLWINFGKRPNSPLETAGGGHSSSIATLRRYAMALGHTPQVRRVKAQSVGSRWSRACTKPGRVPAWSHEAALTLSLALQSWGGQNFPELNDEWLEMSAWRGFAAMTRSRSIIRHRRKERNEF